MVFTTGYAQNAILHNGRLDPDVELITKPYSHAAFTAKIRNVSGTRDTEFAWDETARRVPPSVG